MDVFSLMSSITLDTDGYRIQLEEAGEETSSFGDKLKSGFSTVAKIGATAIGAASTAVVSFATSSVSAGSQFDASMSQVAATAGKTIDEITELRDFAMEMGAKTAFSATQAADALNYMALAGYDADQSMEALPNVLNLAAAGGIDLAYASDMVTDAQSALGLSMEESAELVDKMAMASSKSNTSVAQLGDAILTVGGTAKNLAGGTTELSTALGILADNGVKGAEGGTALRNIILSLAAPTDKAGQFMDMLGLSVYDAAGNMRPLNDIFTDLNTIMSDMDQSDRTLVLSEIFEKADLKSANALLANTGQRFDELSGYIDESAGAAERMAATQLDNLTGDVTLFKSALEGAQIVVSDQLTPTLRQFVQFGSGAISTLSEAFQEGGLSGAMSALGTVLSDGLAMLIEMIPDIVEAGAQLLMALIEGIIQNLPLLIDGAAEVILTLANGIAESLPELIPTIVSVIIQIVETLIDNVDSLVDAAIAIIMALADGIINALPILIEKAPEIITKLVMAIADNLPKIIQAGYEILIKLVGGVLQAIPKMIQAGPQVMSAFVSGIISYFGKLIQVGKNVIGKVGEGIKNMIKSAASWGRDLIDSFIGGIKGAIGKVKDAVSNVADTVKDFLGFSEPEKGPLSNFHTYAPDMMALFAQGIEDNERLVSDQIAKSFNFNTTLTGPEDSSRGRTRTLSNAHRGGGTVINQYIQAVPMTPNELARQSVDAFDRLRWAY